MCPGKTEVGESGPAGSVAEEAARVREEGYIVVRGALDAATCSALREHVLLTTDEAARLGRNDMFGNIQEADRRHDLKLDLCAPVVAALNACFGRCGPLLADVMGPRVRVVELAAITSDRGAVAQPVHADTMHGVTRFLQSDIDVPVPAPGGADSEDEDADDDLGQIVKAVATDTALIFTSLVALQDIDASMGPTHIWPGTHTVEHHATLWSSNTAGKLSVPDADKSFGMDHKKMVLAAGDMVIYDSRTMHCGGAHMGDHRRSVLCISTMGQGIRPDGTTWSMLPSLRNRLRLADFPLPESAARAPTAVAGTDIAATFPPPGAAAAQATKAEDTDGKGRPVPPLDDWASAVQCAGCRRWRPCTVEEAPKLSSAERGFWCAQIGFSCMQEQVYSTQEIDAMFG